MSDEKCISELESDKIKSSEKFKQILKSNGINDPVSEIIIKDAGLQGAGFASLTEYVTVKFEDNLRKEPLNLFVKVKMDNSSHNEWVEEMMAFEKEAVFLMDYCRAAQQLCKLKGVPDFMDFYPKCYYGDSELIVLENLKIDKGYQLIDMDKRQSLEMAKFAIKTIAKHHALSYVMIRENGGPENFFKIFPNLDYEAFDKPVMIKMLSNMFDNSVQIIGNILRKSVDVKGAKEYALKFKEWMDNRKPMDICLDALKNSDDYQDNLKICHVLGHGDYHNTNMMFLLDGATQKVVHHVAIDFQTRRYNTPALDLVHYLFRSVQPKIRRNYLLELLNLHKDTFNKALDDLGHSSKQLLTLDQVFRDFREKVGYGFSFALLVSLGPGAALFKDMDISNMKMEEWPVVMEKLMNKWIEENPEKGKETAEELVELIREYEQLKI